jgi:hypothetical protein
LYFNLNDFLLHRKNPGELKVTIGTLSLVIPDPGEQLITVYKIVVFSQFDPVSLKHNIALIKV